MTYVGLAEAIWGNLSQKHNINTLVFQKLDLYPEYYRKKRKIIKNYG